MHLPSPRVTDLLRALRDLSPAQARAHLEEALATLDEAEARALRALLPAGRSLVPSAEVACLPPPAEAGTIQLQAQELPTLISRFPKPWEEAEPPPGGTVRSTGEMLRLVRPGWSRRRLLGFSAAALIGLGGAIALWQGSGSSTAEPSEPARPLVPAAPAAARSQQHEPSPSLQPSAPGTPGARRIRQARIPSEGDPFSSRF